MVQFKMMVLTENRNKTESHVHNRVFI